MSEKKSGAESRSPGYKAAEEGYKLAKRLRRGSRELERQINSKKTRGTR